jgi:hypothetical protein
MAGRMWTDRSVVYVVSVGDDFRPISAWDNPQHFTDAQVVARNVPLQDARAMVRGLNKPALEAWQADHLGWGHRWAIVVACARNSGWDRSIHVVSGRGWKPQTQENVEQPQAAGGAA